jgi:hypothetical protein
VRCLKKKGEEKKLDVSQTCKMRRPILEIKFSKTHLFVSVENQKERGKVERNPTEFVALKLSLLSLVYLFK